MDLKTFQSYAADAPDLLEQIGLFLQECQEKEILLPKGICNLCDMSWEELSHVPSDAKPLNQDKGLEGPPQPYPAQCPLPPDTRRRKSIVTSQMALHAESSASLRQTTALATTAIAPPSRRRFTMVRQRIGTCVPVTSTLRLYREGRFSHLSFSLAYRESSGPSIPRLHINTLEVVHWAVGKLRPILDLINEEKARLEETGRGRPLTTRHYSDYKVRPPPQAHPHAGDPLFPVIPSTKYLSYGASLKLHYALPDGTCYLYYPSGSMAVCQIPSAQPGGGVYTNVFSETPNDVLQATFRPDGRGFVCHAGKPRSSGFALLVGGSGGRQYTPDGCLAKEWTFNPRGQDEVTHEMKVNENISLTFSNRLAASLKFSVLTENVTLSITQECLLSSSGIEGPGAAGAESVELEVYRAEIQAIRKRVRSTALRWLRFYLVATGLSDEPLFPDPKPRPLKRKPVTVEENPPAFVRPAPLRRNISRPATSLPTSRPTHLFRPRAKSAGLPSLSSPSALLPGEAPPPSCPALLRLLLLRSYGGQACRCSARLPVLSDLELGLFLRTPWSPRGHVLVVYVFSSLHPPAGARDVEAVLQSVHRKQVHASANPCAKSSRCPFRLVKYDMDTANRLTQTPLPVLVQRHHVGPGTLLMYIGGKLVFGGSALNGYGFSKINLLKQIAKTQSDYAKGDTLPPDYRLGGWDAWSPAQRDGDKGDGRIQSRPLRSKSSCSHLKENRLLHRPSHRLSGRASVLATRSKPRQAWLPTPP